MAAQSRSTELFDCLADENLEELVVKLNKLPTGKEFERRAEESMAELIGIEDRTYRETSDKYGDLVGYANEEEERLPWWLQSFTWTVEADPVGQLKITDGNLDEFENYPLDSTRVKNIELDSAESLIEGLDTFNTLEEVLTEALDCDVTEIATSVDFDSEDDPEKYELPDRLFMVPEDGRISTSDEFKNWFERTLNICPPASRELTALLRVNTNIPRRHAEEALESDQIERLEELSVLQPSDEDENTYREEYDESISDLLQISPPFDIDIKIDHDKDRLTDIEYAYYRGWAEDTDRLSNEQKWLRGAKNTESVSESEMYRFAKHAFRTPVMIEHGNLKYEGTESTYSNTDKLNQIASVLEEHGHPVNDD